MKVKYLIDAVAHLPPDTDVKVHAADGDLLREIETVRVEKCVPQGEQTEYRRVILLLNQPRGS